MTKFDKIGPVVSEIICLIKIDTEELRQPANRQIDRRKRGSMFSHSRDHETSRKHESSQSFDRLVYSLGYPREIKGIECWIKISLKIKKQNP